MVTFYRRLPKFEYLAPQTVDEALSLLYQYKGAAKVMAGGTDLVPKLRTRELKAPQHLIDLKGIPGLDDIKYDRDKGLTLGALTTIRAVETSSIIRERFGILFQAAESMASAQVRNRGTIAGNICSAVPSADTAPALLALEARLRLVSREGERMLNIEDFFTGPKMTALTDREILLEIQVPDPPQGSKGVYLKLTPRRSMDLAVVGVAVVAAANDGKCHDLRIALGAVSPTPTRARKAEAVIKGQRLSEELIEQAAQVAAEECCPISDHRASAEYRTEMVRVLTRRGIRQAMEIV